MNELIYARNQLITGFHVAISSEVDLAKLAKIWKMQSEVTERVNNQICTKIWLLLFYHEFEGKNGY